tara:strand:- start:307 stop:483 length:177 start_codon:yes stop_codon:yes gene_type:complete
MYRKLITREMIESIAPSIKIECSAEITVRKLDGGCLLLSHRKFARFQDPNNQQLKIID